MKSPSKPTYERKRHSEPSDILQFSPIGIHWVGVDGIILWANQAELEMLGYTAEEYVGHHIAEFHHEQAVINDILARLTNNETLLDYDARLKCKDGSIRDGLINSNVLWEDGKFVHTRCYTRDVTAQKLAEAELRRAHDDLEVRVAERTAELEKAYADLQIEIEERKQKEELFKAKENQLNEAQRIAHIGSWEWKIDADEVIWSDELYRIFGLKPQEFAGSYQGYLDHVHPDDQEFVSKTIGSALSEGIFTGFDCRIVRPDGTMRVIHGEGFVTSDEMGRPTKMYGTSQDVTERVAIENALQLEREFMTATLDSVSNGIVACNAEGDLTLFNRATLEFHNLPFEPIPAENWTDHYSLFHADGITPMRKEEVPLFRALGGETVRDCELLIAPRNAPSRLLLVNGQPILDKSGNKLGAVVAMNDVTERNRNEQALENSRDYLNSILNSVADPIFVNDREHRMVLVNDAFCQLEGRSREQIIGKTTMDLCEPDEAQIFMGMDNLVFETGEATSNEEQYTDTKGERHVLMTKKSLYEDQNGEQFIVGSIRDITTLKQVEEELSASKALLTKFIDHAPAAVAMLDTKMCYLHVSQRWLSDFKIAGIDIIGKSHYEVLPHLTEKSKEIHRRCMSGEIVKYDGHPFLHNDGTTDWLESETRPWHKPDGEIGGIILYRQIITGRKESEELLRQSEEKYRNILETIEEGYFETDLSGKFTFLNDALAQTTGYDSDELMGVSSRLFTDKVNYRKIHEIFKEVHKTGQSSQIPNWEIIRKNGEGRVHESSVSLALNAANEPIGFRGLVRDITERKRAELEAQVVTEIIQGVTLTSNLEELLMMVHLSIGKVIYAENFYVALYDRQTELINIPFCRDEFDSVALPHKLGKGLTAYIFRHGRPALLTREEIHGLVEEGEIEMVGTPPAVWLGIPLRTPAGVIGVLVVQHYEDETAFAERDIELLSSAGDHIALAIERKRSEDELKESREWLAAMFEASQDGIIVEESEHVVFANKRYKRMCGLEDDQIIGIHISNLLTAEDNERMTEYGRMRKRGEEVPSQYEFKGVDRNGKQTDFEASVSTFTSNGKFYIVTAQKDITERKRVEQALLDASERERAIVDNALDMICTVDSEGRFKSVNQACFRILGYQPEELIGRRYIDFVLPEDTSKTNEEDSKLLSGTDITNFENRYVHKNGNVVDIRWTAYWSENEQLSFSVAHDITVSKRAEEAVQNSRDYLNRIINAVADPIFVKDRSHRWTMMNDAMCEFMGHSREEILGKSDTDFFSKEEADVFWEKDELVFTSKLENINEEQFTDAKGSIRTIVTRKRLHVDTDGEEFIVGVIRDITANKEVEERLKSGVMLQRRMLERQSSILGALPAHICLLDQSGKILEVNEAWKEYARQNGYKGGNFGIGSNYIETCENAEGDCSKEAIKAAEICRAVLAGEDSSGTLEYPCHSPDEKLWYRLTVNPLEKGEAAGAVVMHMNITESKRLESERQVVAEIIQGITATANLNESLALVNESLKKVIYAENCFVALHDPVTDETRFEFWADEIDPMPPPQKIGKSFGNYILKTGKPLLLNKELESELLSSGVVETIGAESPSWLGVPLITPERTVGVLVVQHYQKENVYDQRDLEFLMSVGDQIALALERKRADEKMRNSEQEQRLLAQNLEIERTRLEQAQAVAKVGSWETDLLSGTVTWSAETYRIFAVEPDAFDGTHEAFLKFVHPDDKVIVEKAFNDSISQLAAKPIDHRILLPDGRVKVVRESWQVLCDESGKPIRCLGTSQDVTTQKQDEEKLRASEMRLSEAQHMAGLGSWEWDATLGSVVWSDEFYRIFGFEPKQIEPTFDRYLSFVHPDDLGLVNEMRNQAMHGGGEYDYFHRFHKADGELRVARSKGMVSLGADGTIVKITGTIQDITVQKELENELKHTRDAALETARLKSEFLANMSHEIRTPMNGVVGMTGLLLDTELSSRQKEYAETIQSSADSLLTIIDDILDFSKIESGLLRFETIDFDLRSAVESPLALLAEKAQAKGLEVASLVYQDVPTDLRGDPGRLRQILTNLIGNAVKFTDNGEVVVSVKKETEDRNQIVLRFEIKDTGIGISQEAQKRLFQAFTQADGSTTRKYGGTGLGLAISKQLVELMDGTIGIDSSPGAGSTFWFTGKFEKQTESSQTLDQPFRANLNDIRVLIVDDNATNRKIMVHQSESWGMIAAEADSGQRALELLYEAAADGQPFNVALLDLMMPEMDGFQLADAIKGDPVIAGVSLVLLPSFGQRGHGEAARNVGIAAYLQKPVKQSQLFDCLATVTAGFASSGTGRKLVTQHTLEENRVKRDISSAISGARILVAEDNPVNQKVALGQLENLGHAAQAAMNGLEVMKAIEAGDFDIIFMDCQMPEMDGFEATAEIRRREGNGRRTVIVAMTANALEGDREKCIAAGMDDYLSKPVKSGVLSEMLGRWLKVPEAETPSIEKNGDSRAVDLSVIGSLREMQQEGEPDFVTEVIDLFLEDAALQLEQLRIALTANDSEERIRLAHLIKGSSANVGAEEMARLLDDLEHREINVADGKTAYENLEGEFKRVKADLMNERRVPDAVLPK